MIQRNHRPAVITIHTHGQNQASENEKMPKFQGNLLKNKISKIYFLNNNNFVEQYTKNELSISKNGCAIPCHIQQRLYSKKLKKIEKLA